MSGLCKDCRWWTFPAPDEHWGPQPPDDFGVCEMTRRDLGDMVHPETKAIPADDEGNWRHVLATLPEFGCNQFESLKETE